MPRLLKIISIILLAHNSFGQVEYAKKIIDTLCSPHFDGRGYVDNGDVRAADFIVDELKRIGAEPLPDHNFTQEYTMSVNTFPYSTEVILGEKKLIPGENYLVSPISGTAQGEFSVIEINNNNFENKYNGDISFKTLDPSQTIFVFNYRDSANKRLEKKALSLAYECTKYFPSMYVSDKKLMHGVSTKQSNYPLIMVDSAAYESVDKIKLKVNNKYIPNYKTKNVIACIPGRRKRKYVVFAAHYDHLGRMGPEVYFPGANDNASGVAMLLSLAKHYKQNKPKYTTVFCFFSGEEAGLLGSKYFVEHPFMKLKKIKFVLDIDIMGGASTGITVVNGTKHKKAFKKMTSLNEDWDFLSKVIKRGPTSNSDHYYFSENGVPAFFIYSVGNVKNYHDINDKAKNTPLTNFDQVQELLEKFVQSL